MSETKMHLVPWERLQANTISVFRAAGSQAREAQLIAEHLVEANLRGHDSHGVGVVPMYLNGVRSGGMETNQTLKVAVDTGAMLICDAGQGAGQVMAHDAMALGIARAKDEGSAIVSLPGATASERNIVSVDLATGISTPTALGADDISWQRLAAP